MLNKQLRERLRARAPLIGTFVMLPSPDVAELAASCGFDIVIIDLEHAGKDWSTVQHMVRAVEVAGASAFVRVSGRDDAETLRVLELGVAGIVVPFVESANDARRIAEIVRYAPQGSRGTCRFTRAAAYGLRKDDFPAFVSETNESLIVLGQIESIAGIRNIQQILGVERAFDGFIIGRGDLASDIGMPGAVEHADVLAHVNGLVDAVLDVPGTALGIVTYDPQEAVTWRSRGISLVIYSTDAGVLAGSYQTAVRAMG